MLSAFSARLRPAVPAAFLGVLAVFLFWDVLFGGRRLFFGDLGLYFVPLLHVQRTELLAGKLILWNPYILCGTPFWGNPQAFPLYPTSLLLLFMPASQAVGVIAALHSWLAAWGTFLFLRRRGLCQSAALFGAVAWGMGGAIVSKTQFPNMIQVAAFLPFVLIGIENGVAKPGARTTAPLAALIGLSLLGAHPQMALMQFYVGLAWAIFLLREQSTARTKAAYCLCGGLVLGLALASAQLLPTVELVRYSVRTHLSLSQANRFILPTYAVLTNFVAPNFYGNPASDPPYVGRGNFWEPCAYVGLVPFGFALWAIVRLRGKAEVRFFCIVALVGIWLALGKDAGLWALAFYAVPGVGKFHDAARFLYVGTFGVACLGAFGLDAFLRAQTLPFRRRLWGAAFVLLTSWQVISFGRTLNPTTPASVWQAVENGPKSTNQRTYFADEHAAWARFVSYQSYQNVQTTSDVRRFLLSHTPNTNVFANGKAAGGYEPVQRRDTNTLLASLKAGFSEGRDADASQILRTMGGAQITGLDKNFVPQTRPVPGAWGRATLRVPGSSYPLPLRVLDNSPQSVTVFLPPNHEAGFVVLADTNHPGWTAKIDNKPAQVPQMTGGAFRGVDVSKNARKIDFVYAPSSVRVGVFLSLSAAGILSALTFAQRGTQRKAKMRAAPRLEKKKWQI